MREILNAKLAQCKEFSESLSNMSNKNTVFVEAAYNDYWGSGLTKIGTLNTDIQHWPGKNELGRMYMYVELARGLRNTANSQSSMRTRKTTVK